MAHFFVNDVVALTIYRLYTEANGSLSRGSFHQLRKSGQPGTNLLSMITNSSIDEWRPWVETTSGRRGEDYKAAKEARAQLLIDEAAELFGLREMNVLDVYSPLTIRDSVSSPGGSAYGIMRTTNQLMRAISLNRTPVKGLYPAGQNRLAPWIMGTMLGSFQVVRQVIGPELFMREVAGRLL